MRRVQELRGARAETVLRRSGYPQVYIGYSGVAYSDIAGPEVSADQKLHPRISRSPCRGRALVF